MAKVTIEFPSVEMANLFVSTIGDGIFSDLINDVAQDITEYRERLDKYPECAVQWDESERGNHEIDFTGYIVDKDEL